MSGREGRLKKTSSALSPLHVCMREQRVGEERLREKLSGKEGGGRRRCGKGE